MREGIERDTIRVLDACLSRLEEAHLRGITIVTNELATGLAAHIPGIRARMSITGAIQLVFDEQQRILGRTATPRNAGHPSDAADLTLPPCRPTVDLDEQEARALTGQIRSATKHVCLLLLEAHRRGAPAALGYRSWEEYVRAEFGLSRSRSYELLDQARVILALKEAAGMSGIPDVSAYTAGRIKARLQDVVRAIQFRIQRGPALNRAALVQDVVSAAQIQPVPVRESRTRRPPQTLRESSGRVDLPRLLDIVDDLAGLPPAASAVTEIALDQLDCWSQTGRAARWLAEFADQICRRLATSRAPASEPVEYVPDRAQPA